MLPAAMPGETGSSVTQGTNMKEERKQEQELLRQSGKGGQPTQDGSGSSEEEKKVPWSHRSEL